MTTASIKLYDILVDKGVDRTLAREAVDEFLTREEASQMLATKSDLTRMIMWMAGMFIGHFGVSVAVMAFLIELRS